MEKFATRNYEYAIVIGNCIFSKHVTCWHSSWSLLIIRAMSLRTVITVSTLVAPGCLLGLTFPDFDLAPKRNEKFDY